MTIYLMDDDTAHKNIMGHSPAPHVVRFTLHDGSTVDSDPCTFSGTGWEHLMQALADATPIVYLRSGRVNVINGDQIRLLTFLPDLEADARSRGLIR